MNSLKSFVKSFIKKDSFIYKAISKVYHFLSSIKYRITNSKKIKVDNEKYTVRVNEAIEIIKKYKDTDYIVLYNPTWLGVANSTKGLFKNIVPLEQVFGRKNINNIAKTIVESNIKTVIFSQIVDGWTDVLKEIKKRNSNVQIKVIWHANSYESFSDYTWQLNKNVIDLYNQKQIDCFAFVKNSMVKLYNKIGYKAFWLQNNVHFKEEDKKYVKKEQNDKIKIGVYNADSRELKNMYTALSSIKLLENSIADVVPINKGAKDFCKIINLEYTYEDTYIPTEDLLKRIQQNDINVYPTFTESSPMFPIESFEMGIPCLLGNNNDFFRDTELGKYVILEREDDQEYIRDRILYCLEHKDEIMKIYKQWKIDFDKKCDELVEEYIKY